MVGNSTLAYYNSRLESATSPSAYAGSVHVGRRLPRRVVHSDPIFSQTLQGPPVTREPQPQTYLGRFRQPTSGRNQQANVGRLTQCLIVLTVFLSLVHW